MARAPIGRQQLLDAAHEELVRGNGVLELAGLTRRAGLSTGALYHHFGSKNGLLAAIYDGFYAGLNDAIRDANLPSEADWATRERERTRRFVAYHFTEPLAPIVLQRSAQDPQLVELEAVWVQGLAADAAINIRRGQGDGDIPGDVEADSAGAFVIGGLRDGIGQQLRLAPRPDLETATDRLWRLTAGALGLA